MLGQYVIPRICLCHCLAVQKTVLMCDFFQKTRKFISEIISYDDFLLFM